MGVLNISIEGEKHIMHTKYAEHAEMAKTTTIRIELDTRDQLRLRGRMGESYDDVIRRLLTGPISKDGARATALETRAAFTSKPLFNFQKPR
jgi:hypothetical protein